MKNWNTLGLNGLKKASNWLNQYSPSFKVFVEKKITLRVGTSSLQNTDKEIIKKRRCSSRKVKSLSKHTKEQSQEDNTLHLSPIHISVQCKASSNTIHFKRFITKQQFFKLRKDFKNRGISISECNNQLEKLHQETADLFQINWQKDFKYKKMSCKKEERITVSVRKDMSTSHEPVIEKRVQKVRSSDSKGDFSTLDGCVVFRGYVWPYEMTNKMRIAEKAIEICYNGCQTG